MTIQTSPNGVLTQSADGVKVSNLGALAAGVNTITVANMGDVNEGTVAAGVAAILVMPPMPVGSEIDFIVTLANGATLQFLEITSTGAAVIISGRNAAGNIALRAVAPTVIPAGALLVVGQLIQFGTAAATLAAIGIFGVFKLTLRKVQPNTAAIADGWEIVDIKGYGPLA